MDKYYFIVSAETFYAPDENYWGDLRSTCTVSSEYLVDNLIRMYNYVHRFDSFTKREGMLDQLLRLATIYEIDASGQNLSKLSIDLHDFLTNKEKKQYKEREEKHQEKLKKSRKQAREKTKEDKASKETAEKKELERLKMKYD